MRNSLPCAANLFFFLHIAKPEIVSFDYKVILSAVLGTFVAVMNFYLMGITVQEIVNTENPGGCLPEDESILTETVPCYS